MGGSLRGRDRNRDRLPGGRIGRRHPADQKQDRGFRSVRGAIASGRTGRRGAHAVSNRRRRRGASGERRRIGPGQLRLTGSVLADIYLGKIAKWNVEAIRELNPGLALPDQAIIPIHRADASGTTYVLADYLARVSAEWRDEIGVNIAVAFPTGMGGKGNEGIAGF